MGILSRARYVRKIFSAPLRTEREREREKIWIFNPFPISWSSALGERERAEPSERGRGLFLWWRRDPPLPSYSVPLSLRIASSILPSFPLIPDNARARFPLRLAHIKRQQCLNPFIIFPLPRVLSISPSSSSKPRLRSWGPRLRLVSLECVHSATREYKQFRQTREDGNRGLSRQTR